MHPAEIINVVVGRNRDGWYVARSDELPGLYVAHEEIEAVISDVPAAIAALYRADYGQEVQVIAGAYRGGSSAAGMPWITIPAHQDILENRVWVSSGMKELERPGLQRTDETTATTRLRTPDGRHVTVPICFSLMCRLMWP